MAVRKPAPLSPGARIGVVAPAGSVDRRSLLAGVAAIEAQGYAVELAQNVFQTKGYLAGEPACRAGDLTNFFRRGDIAAIFCARGGFGSIQMLDFLTDEIMKHPKIFVGYSDNTVLLDWLRARCGMVTFHGPMVAMDLAQGISSRSGEHFWGMLSGRKRAWKLPLGEVIRNGKIEAEMTGGCLSLLVTTLGTTYEIDTRGRILFLEDVGEPPYRIERMLTHLKMAGKLDHPAGVVFGDFTRCEGEAPRDVRAVIGDLFAQAPYPVVLGLPAGHGEENLALPFGVKMRLDGDGATLEMLESPVL
ncbi:MAG TPA: LD-carboxypeptidase [Candidatus Binatia bacterium]|nr:LD-carboxypeptidase [Candidatus Binatia bacterium]